MPLYQKFHNSSFCFIFIYFSFLFFPSNVMLLLNAGLYTFTLTQTHQLSSNWSETDSVCFFFIHLFVCFVKLFQDYKSTAEIKLPTKVSSKEELIIRNQLNISLLKLISRDENQLRNNQIPKNSQNASWLKETGYFYLKIILH